jgi:hypothetical protein
MAHNGQPEASAADTPPRKGLHEWAERLAVPTFDYIADPIAAVVEGLTHPAHHEPHHREPTHQGPGQEPGHQEPRHSEPSHLATSPDEPEPLGPA